MTDDKLSKWEVALREVNKFPDIPPIHDIEEEILNFWSIIDKAREEWLMDCLKKNNIDQKEYSKCVRIVEIDGKYERLTYRGRDLGYFMFIQEGQKIYYGGIVNPLDIIV